MRADITRSLIDTNTKEEFLEFKSLITTIDTHRVRRLSLWPILNLRQFRLYPSPGTASSQVSCANRQSHQCKSIPLNLCAPSEKIPKRMCAELADVQL